MKKQKAAMLAAALGNGIFGFSFMFSRLALRSATPVVLLAYRFAAAWAVMTVLLLARCLRVDYRGKKLWKLLILGIFQPVLYFTCENYGILYTSATFSGVMIALIPICSLAFGALFLRERPTAAQLLFSVLSVAGVLLVSVSPGGEGVITARGVALMVGAVMTAVGFNLYSRKLSVEFSTVERTYSMFVLGVIFFGALAVRECGGSAAALLEPLREPGFVAAVAFLGILSSIGAFLCLNYANTYLPVARATSFANISTLISLFAGVVFLHEPFGWLMLPAAAMIVAGVWGVQKFTRQSDKKGV